MRSMTGYGKGTYSDENFEIEIEIKSVNHRFLDLRIYLSRELNPYEMLIRDIVMKKMRRGKVDVRINFRDKRLPSLSIDQPRLLALWELYNNAKNLLNTQQEIPLDKIMAIDGVVLETLPETDKDIVMNALTAPLVSALDEHTEMALREGESMQDFLVSSVMRITSALAIVENEFPEFRNEMFMKYKNQLATILNDTLNEEDERRILTETAIFIEKADINEEIIRLKDHVEKFRDKLFVENAELGKSLNFILQEMHREANTMSVKFNNSKVFPQLLTIKEEIEKCREMVQNVE